MNKMLPPPCLRGILMGVFFLAAALPIGIWNHELFHLLNGINALWLDRIVGVIGGFGDGLVIALIISCVMLFRLRLGIAAIIAFLASGLIIQILKRIFDAPRPPALFENVHLLGSALQSHSFPSGHATSSGVMILLALLLWKRDQWQMWVGAAIFSLAAYSRVYGGVHFPIDVWIGAGIGLFCMSAAKHWVTRWPKSGWEESPMAWKIPVMILLVEAVVLGLGYPIQPSTATVLTLILPIAALFVLMRFWKQKFNHG